MGKTEKLLDKLLKATSDNNIDFYELRNLLNKLGFKERIKGSHHIYYKEGIEEIINIQNKQGNAKPYKVKQIRQLILKYKLKLSSK